MSFRPELRVLHWLYKLFGYEQTYSKKERALRVLEEAMELAQACGVEPSQVNKLRKHVWSQPNGKIKQEIAGVMVTIRGMAAILGEDADDLFEREMERIEHPDMIEKVREKQALKAEAGITA